MPVQIGMLATITAIYGLQLSEGFLSTLLASASGTMVATFAGQSVVSGLLKLVPGPGTGSGWPPRESRREPGSGRSRSSCS